MSNPEEIKRCSCALRPHELALWVVRPIARRLMLHHRIGIEQSKQFAQELQQVKDAIEIIRQQLDCLTPRRE